jgi:putative transposase
MKKKENQLDPKFIDELAKKYTNPEDIFGKDGLFKQIQKALLERMLSGELTTELGSEKNSSEGNNTGNSRNGYSEKTLSVPRNRNGEFEPKIIAKNQARLNGLDEKIISLYARGMTTRDIQEQLKDLYDVEISATMISNVTNEVIDEVKTWQSRPLDKIYPIVFLDALVIKIQEDKRVINKAFYLALGINCDGEKELLGIWVSQNEGAKFWLSVLTEIKNRGVEDIFIACVDGLTVSSCIQF